MMTACVPANRLHEPGRGGGNAREVAEQVQGRTLGGQDRAQRSAHDGNRRTGGDAVAVGGGERYRNALVHQRERPGKRREAGHDAGLAADRIRRSGRGG